MSELPPPVFQRDADDDCPVQAVLTCTLCHEMPMLADAVVTPCHHIFCETCIQRALENRSECPNDRYPLLVTDLQPISGALRRIWESVPVKCPQCNWNGTVGNYATHARHQCTTRRTIIISRPERAAPWWKMNVLRNHIRRGAENLMDLYEQQVANLTIQHRAGILQQGSSTSVLATVWEQVEAGLVSLVRDDDDGVRSHTALGHHHSKSTIVLDPDYGYDRYRIVELTQLICVHLENRPVEIDSDRIYNCIRDCYNDYVQQWADNPNQYELYVRMLLNVCRATDSTTWFTDTQKSNFNDWCSQQGW